MPFCFSWANQSWVHSWSNLKGFAWMSGQEENQQNQEASVIFQQKYEREAEWERHFQYLLPFFKDKRYIRHQGKPLMVIHVMNDVPCLYEMLRYWEKLAVQNGLEGLSVIGGGQAGITYGTDAVMTHEPGDIKRELAAFNKGKKPVCYSYQTAYETILSQKYPPGCKMIYTAFCSYDTTPRYGKDGCVFLGSTPELFEEYLAKLMAKNAAAGNEILFIDAWNEWGEGMHLEPDQTYGLKWLKAVRNAKAAYRSYLPQFCSANQQMGMEEYRLRCKQAKFEMYLNVLSDWMDLRSKGKTIVSYFQKYHLEKILIYGYGIFAGHLITECREQKIPVEGIIDREIVCPMDGIDTYHMEEDLPSADGIIVTAFYYMDEICTEIRNYNKDIPIYSISEIIYEMLYL